jgi:hypothetical protein
MSALRCRLQRFACVSLALWLGACSQQGTRELELTVVDDRGEALAEVPVHADTRLLAHSDAAGKLRLPADRLPPNAKLVATCPEAYRPAEALSLAQPRSPSLQFVCRPRLRTLAVVAYAPTAVGALLRADAQALGRVAPDGTLHAVLRRPPGASFQLSLESHPALTRRVQVRDRDEIVVLDGAP